MNCSLVLTILGSDRPGLVNALAETVSRHGGNWLESRMAKLAGQFAGIVRVEIPADRSDSLLEELRAPGIEGLTIHAVREEIGEPEERTTLVVSVLGNDRPGIVRDLTKAIASTGANVVELTTGLESAPMTGQPMFRARGVVSLPEGDAEVALRESIEQLGADLTVDFEA